MDYSYLLKILEEIRIEIVVEREFDDPQGEKTSGKSCWVRTQDARGLLPKIKSQLFVEC